MSVIRTCQFCGQSWSGTQGTSIERQAIEAENCLEWHIKHLCQSSPRAISEREAQEAQERERRDRRDRDAQERDRRREAERATGSSSNDSSSGNEWFWGIILVMGALQIIADWFNSLHWFWQVLIVLTTLTLVLAALANHFGWGDDE